MSTRKIVAAEFERTAMCVSEGICPDCHTSLVRESDYGRCNTCRLGWQLRPAREDEKWMGEVVVHTFVIIEVDIPDGLRKFASRQGSSPAPHDPSQDGGAGHLNEGGTGDASTT